MNTVKKLAMVIELLHEAMDHIDDINTNDETEKYYCRVRDIATELQYDLDDINAVLKELIKYEAAIPTYQHEKHGEKVVELLKGKTISKELHDKLISTLNTAYYDMVMEVVTVS